MNQLTKKELETIKKVCGQEYADRLHAVQNRQHDNIVKIVNTGMVSSGKSSLYNILINSDQEEFFPTGAARTTTKASYYDYKNISYIDTPGIDVRNEDDALAYDTIIGADIILMIHNIRTGPLNKSEVDWLNRITRGMSSVEMCLSRIVFVLSWKDTREKDEDYTELVENIKKQVFEIVGGEIPFYEVSSKKYLQGAAKDKEVLVKKSGIVELRQYLEAYADEYIRNKEYRDRQEYQSILSHVKELLRTDQQRKETEKENIYKKHQDRVKSKKGSWNGVYDSFSLKREKLAGLERELKSIKEY